MAERTSKPTTLLGTQSSSPNWARRRDIAFALIGWFIILAIALWAVAHIIGALLTVGVAALLAYAIAPIVRLLTRRMPRPLAIAVTYVLAVGVLGLVLYVIVMTAVTQLIGFAHQISLLLAPGKTQAASGLATALSKVGISVTQLQALGNQLTSHLQDVATTAVPILAGVFGGVLDTILVIVLSIYFVIDGARLITWLRMRSPIQYRTRINFLLNTFERVLGGYIRGQLSLAALIGVLVGFGMMVMQIPYAELLGLIAFIFEFIPIIGVFLSGAACVLLALTKGPIWAVLVLAYFIFVHIIEGDVVGPRIVGRAVGLHPAVSIFALLAGAELFGLWGALFASPVAGVIQAVMMEVWSEWRENHPHQFPEYFGPTVVPVTTHEALADDQPTVVWHPPGPGSGALDGTAGESSDAANTGATTAFGMPPPTHAG
jgi:predicted PurR-regulated permease PerM